MEIAFDNEKYLKIQKEKIEERIKMFDNKMYAYYKEERDLTNNHSNLDNQANINNQISTDKKNVYFDM